MKSKIAVNTLLSLLTIIVATSLIQAQGIEITPGGNMKVVGNPTIYINNGNFENNGTYSKGTETFTFTGTEEKTITGNDLDLYHLVVTNTGGVVTQIDLLTTNNLDIASASIFTIQPGKSVTVNNTLSNAGGSSGLVIKSDATGTGSLIHYTENVPATVECFVTGDKWHYLFAPLTGIATELYTVEGAYTNYNLFSYTESTADYWDAVTTYGTTGWTPEYGNLNLPVSKGYIYNREAMADNTISQTGGTLFVGEKLFDVGYTTNTGLIGNGVSQGWTNFDGWNLTGNPYVSAIDWDLINKDDIEAGVYVYDGVNYQYYVMGGGSSPWDVGITVNGGSNYIPSGQGFFVKMKDTGASHSGTFSIPENARVHNAQALWKKSISDVPNILKMSITGEGFSDETVIRTVPGVTEGHDPDYDAHKLFSWDVSKPKVFSFNTDSSSFFAINAMPEIETEHSVGMGVSIGTPGDYTIQISNNTFAGFNVYLEDKDTDKMMNVQQTPDYEFYSETGSFFDRFVMHFNLNHAPVSNVQNLETDEDAGFVLDLTAAIYDADPLDEITVEFTELPEWVTNNGLLLSGTPANHNVGIHTVRLRATDLSGATTDAEFSITVNNTNDAPEMVLSLPDYNALTGTELVIEIDINTFTDIDPGDVLSYTSDYPSWLNFSVFTMSYSGIPEEEGTEDVLLTASDIEGASVTGQFSIFVTSSISIDDKGLSGLNVYPNPSHGLFVVDLKSDGRYTVTVTDMTGNLIKQYKDIKPDHFKIDLSEQSNGMYYIELTSGEQLFTGKLVKF